MMFQKFGERVLEFLSDPGKVFWSCVAFGCMSVLLNGSLIQLWSLHQQKSQLTQSIGSLELKRKDIITKLKRAQDPEFIERQAREQFDLVADGDLVFVFSED